MWRCQTQQILQPIDKITFRHKENHIILDKKHKNRYNWVVFSMQMQKNLWFSSWKYTDLVYDGYSSHITIQKNLLKKPKEITTSSIIHN